MSSARAQANHKLYLAKILLAGWREAAAEQDVPALTLTQAYLPAVRAHLLDAYGWFLLQVSGSEQGAVAPPHCCADLPEIADGTAVSGEIREFEQLETSGWLAELLAEPAKPGQASRLQGNLAAPSPAQADCEQVQQWVTRLEEVFDRMSDSLDEY